MIVEELIALLGFDLKGEENLRRFTGGLQKATGVLAAFAARAAVFAAAAATAIGAGVGKLGIDAVKVGSTFEDLSATLETIEGSSDKAKQSLAWIQDFATKTPYDLQQVSEAFVRLKANGLEPQEGLLRSIGDASSAMGKSLMDGVEAIADAVRGENERLKELGITAKVAGEKVTYSWSQNGKTMTKTVKKDAAEIQAALQGIFDSRFLGAMEKRSTTFSGIVANLGDMWTNFLLRISDAGLLKWVKTQFKTVLDTIQTMVDDGTLDALAKKISETLVETGEAVKALFADFSVADIADFVSGALRFMAAIGRMVKSIFDAVTGIGKFISSLLGLQSTWKGVLIALAAAGLVFAPFFTALAAVMLAIDEFIAWLNGRKSVLGSILDGIEELFASWGVEIDLSPEAIGKGIMQVVDTLKRAYATIASTLSSIKDAISRITLSETFQSWAETSERLGTSMATLGKGLGDAADALIRFFASISSNGSSGKGGAALASLGGYLSHITSGTITGGLKVLQGAFETLSNVFSTFGTNLSQLAQGDLSGFVRTLAEGVQRQGQIIKDTFEGVVKAFAPDFSFMDAWNRVVAFFEAFVAKIEAIVGKIEALAKRIADAFNAAIPEPPQWWKDASEQNRIRVNSSEAGSAIGGMVPPKKTSGDQSMQNVDSLLTAIASAASKIEAVTGAGAAGKAVETVANDNRVTDNRVFNAPVKIEATINNGTAAQVGAAAGGAVRAALGDVSLRNLAVTANPGGMAK